MARVFVVAKNFSACRCVPGLQLCHLLLLTALMTSLNQTVSSALQFPTFSLSEAQFNDLPPYCKISTGYFPCVDIDTGAVHCHPVAMRCRIHCANDAQLDCPHAVANCSAGLFRCASHSDQPQQQPVCLPDHLLCDGRLHCPLGDDESPQLCQSRSPCPPDHFSCRSPGHCLPSVRRCDGFFDCRRPGLDDQSDEADCPTVASAVSGYSEDSDGCKSSYHICDGFPDCPDGSDELHCPGVDGNSADRPVPTAKSEMTASSAPESLSESGSTVRIVVATVDKHSGLPYLSIIDRMLTKRTTTLPKLSGMVVAIDAAAGLAFLYNEASGHLRSVNWQNLKRSSRRQDVDVNLGGRLVITDAAYDSTRRLLFYSSSVDGTVGVIAIDAGWRAPLRLLDCPRGLLAHPETSALFLALECGPAPGIYRLSMDGRELRLLIGSKMVGRPTRFGFDSVTRPKRLFWIDTERLGVFSVRLEDGGDVRKHFSWPHEQSGIETARLVVDGNRLYLSAINGNVCSVLYLTPGASSDKEIFAKVHIRGASVTLLAALPESGIAESQPRCDCQQICVPVWDTPTATECLCDWHYSLARGSSSQQTQCIVIRGASAPETNTSVTTDTTTDATKIDQTIDQGVLILILVSIILIAVMLLLTVILRLWLKVPHRCLCCSKHQSIKLSETDKHETAKLTSVQTFATMLSVESRSVLLPTAVSTSECDAV